MKSTNLDKVKSMALAFLYIDVKPSRILPMSVCHPFFNSVMADLPDYGIFNILEDTEHFEVIRQKYKQRILNSDCVQDIMSIIREPYQLGFLKNIVPSLSQTDLSQLLSMIWVNIENPNQDVNASVSEIARWFKKADKESLMNQEDYEVYCNLPECFTVYRGVAAGRNPDGLSWTRSLHRAEWFAHRFDKKEQQGYVREANVLRKDVLAYFNTRGEEEIVVHVK